MYVSSATRLLNAEELDSLISHSQLKNAHFGVTGCVIYNDGNILQYLEGTKASVDFIYGSIVLDSRHTGIQRLCYAPVEQRSFGDWPMALKYIPDTEYDYTSLYKLFEDIIEKKQVDKLCVCARVFFETFLRINQLHTGCSGLLIPDTN
jgi:hypothetical protein